MPSLSVRAFAELIHLPAYEHVRILTEQKYPTAQPQSYMVPFYQPCQQGIKNYYQNNNNAVSLATARATIRRANNPARRRNNEQVLVAFENSAQANRRISTANAPTLRANVLPDVQLKLVFDLAGMENNRPCRIFYNMRATPIDAEIAKTTLQIAYWVLDQNGTAMPFRALEYIDLRAGNTHRITRQSQAIIRKMRANARVISALWPAI
jgi:hypothetical protein